MRLTSTWLKFLDRKVVTGEQSMQCPVDTAGSFDGTKEGEA